jgi:hypothetical protein
MSAWTKQSLEQLIADMVEESLTVEYKRSLALAKTDGNKTEITKDASAFANSSGGVLIYGIAEPQDKAKRHLPERLDPILRTEFSKEWLEQIIQGIQPRVDGVLIHPVTIDEQKNQVCYVVEIPQSSTAHQARDHVYYKRHNFNVLPMEDYEVRDVMNRKTHPKIRASIFINKHPDKFKPEGVVLVKLENVGRVLTHHMMVELELPLDMAGPIAVDEPAFRMDTAEGTCDIVRLTPDPGQAPIFPGSEIILRRKIYTNVENKSNSGEPVTSTRHVKVSIFADETPPLRAKLDFAPVILGWTPVGRAEASSG